jgi:esterase/lipase superfamily enzyme
MARGLEAIIQKCLNKEPSNRYQSGRELASALQSASRAVDLIEQLGAGARATAAKAGPFDFIHASREPGERPPKKEEKYQVVEVLYATDRKATGKTAPGKFFGGERSDGSSLSLGICEVSIPFDHKIGELESPSILKLEFSPDPEEHIALLRIEPATEAGFYLHLSSRVAASARSGAFVFIHGYSVTFEDAARRTAQLAYDLKFSGPPIFYSWPSQGAKAKYTVDETNIEWTIPHLQGFLARIASESGATTLHLIAHSMGNRALTRALVELSRAAVEATDRPRFRQIVLTAPDIDADVFRQLAAAMQKAAERITLYASSEDEALKLSKKFHGYPRAGDVGESIVVCPGVDTVDVSAVDTSLLGHSYYGDNRSVIGDLFNLLQDGAPPSQRFGLLPVKWKELQYWRFQP